MVSRFNPPCCFCVVKLGKARVEADGDDLRIEVGGIRRWKGLTTFCRRNGLDV